MKYTEKTKYCSIIVNNKRDVILETQYGTFHIGDQVKHTRSGLQGEIIHFCIRDELAREIIPLVLVNSPTERDWCKVSEIKKIRARKSKK